MSVSLVEAFGANHQINLIKANDKSLGGVGRWVGLCKVDKEGKPHKVFRWSCMVLMAESPTKDVIKEYFTCSK